MNDAHDVRFGHGLWIALLLAALAPSTLTAASSGRHAIAGAEIYSVASDGSDLVDLTNNPATDTWPAVSADGSRIAFVSDRDGYPAIYVMNADGSDQQRVCPATSSAAARCVAEGYRIALDELVWSPAGNALGFTASFLDTPYCYSPAREDFVLDLGSGGVRSLGPLGLVGAVRFSPHGRYAAVSYGCGSAAVGGSSVLRVDTGASVDEERDYAVAWSPRAERLLYLGRTRQYVKAADAAGGHRWTLHGPSARVAMWSPGGGRIAFFRKDGARRGLYVVRVGRQDAVRTLRFVAPVGAAAWSRNGSWIAFSAADGSSAGSSGTFFVEPSGKRFRRASRGLVTSGWSPLAWSPDSRHFAFVAGDRSVRVVAPPDAAAVAVTTPSELEVCALPSGGWECRLGWTRNRLVFAARPPMP